MTWTVRSFERNWRLTGATVPSGPTNSKSSVVTFAVLSGSENVRLIALKYCPRASPSETLLRTIVGAKVSGTD